VVWRALGSTLEAIASLNASSVPLRPIVCVAQELSEPDKETLGRALVGHDLILLDDNIGFSAAVNVALDRLLPLGVDWALLVNNDATIDTDCVERCLGEASRGRKVAVVSPAIAYMNRPGRLWFAGAAQSRWLGLVWHRGYFADSSDPPPSRDCDFIPSCAALMSMTAWSEIGPFRVDYFMYFEDVEWGARARERGWKLRYLGAVLALHEVGGSSERGGSRLMGENAAYYLARNPVRFALDTGSLSLRVSRTFGLVVIWTLYNLTRIKPSDWTGTGRAMLQGIADGWRGRMGRRDLVRARRA
jgi:GT2 family glycosyltransferase